MGQVAHGEENIAGSLRAHPSSQQVVSCASTGFQLQHYYLFVSSDYRMRQSPFRKYTDRLTSRQQIATDTVLLDLCLGYVGFQTRTRD